MRIFAFILPQMILLLAMALGPSVCAQGKMEGHVEAGDVYVKLSRPVRIKPAPPVATSAHLPSFSGAFVAPQQKKMEAAIDSRDFLLGGKASELAGDEESIFAGEAGKNSRSGAGAEDQSRELVIAWERWHKAVAAAIYSRWRTYGIVPGEEKVKMTFYRDGELKFEFSGYNAFSEISEDDLRNRMEFEENINRTLHSLNHNPILAFPPKSQRKKVVLESLFSSHYGCGLSGYSWKRGDYEHLNAQGR